MGAESTIVHSFWKHVRTQPQRLALRVKRHGRYCDIRWDEFGQSVKRLVVALAEEEVGRGEVVAILSNNRPEWAMADLAILSLGAISVSVYATHLPKDVAYILNHSGAKLVFAEDQTQVDKILAVRGEVPSLKKVVRMAGEVPGAPGDFIIPWNNFLQQGECAATQEMERIEPFLAALAPEDLAIVIYTSGTTGPPKGVMLTHDNLRFICETCSQLNMTSRDDVFFSFLPLAHALERVGSLYVPVFLGAQVGYAERMETVAENLAEVAPTIVAGVPRFFEKIYQRVMATVAAGPAYRQVLYRWAMAVGKKSTAFQVARRPLPLALRCRRAVADRLVYRKLRRRMGGRLRFFLSGGAPLGRDIAEFFYALGLPIFEGYGATETTAPASANRDGEFKFGTVGKPLPGVEIKIAADGEILIRGRNVFRGYFKNEQATQEALVDGWYYSGDIGRMDDDGFLTILDRKKELIITSAGKNISPQNIEGLLKQDPLVSQAVAIGDRRNFLTALLTLNPEFLASWAQQIGLTGHCNGELTQHPRVVKRVHEIVEQANQELARFEQIKKFRILPDDFSQASGELTPTLKLRRKFIAEKYAREIAGLYEEGIR